MGISYPVPVSQLELGDQSVYDYRQIDDTYYAGEIALIPLPAQIHGKIERAYLDWYIPWVENSSGNANYLSGATYITVMTTGATLNMSALIIPSGVLYTPASTTWQGSVRFVGSIDITATVDGVAGNYAGNRNLRVYLNTTKARYNYLTIRWDYAVLRINLKG